MSEEAVVEKWAPESLDSDQWGALIRPTVDLMRGAHERQRFPQSLLLIGPKGLGRELAALSAAMFLTCPENGRDFCACGSCRRVRGGQHPDVRLVLPQGRSSQIKIDQIRQVVREASGRPYEASRRVWIFDGVEVGSFGAEAANAFLKALEEPPSHVIFILLAGNPTAVLPTIRSRCQKLALPGAVAVARDAGDDRIPPELTPLARAGAKVSARVERTREVLGSAMGGEVAPLLLLAQQLGEDRGGFEILACVAMELAAGAADGETAERWVCLAADVLRAEQRASALNLNPERQLLACLLTWFDRD